MAENSKPSLQDALKKVIKKKGKKKPAGRKELAAIRSILKIESGGAVHPSEIERFRNQKK